MFHFLNSNGVDGDSSSRRVSFIALLVLHLVFGGFLTFSEGATTQGTAEGHLSINSRGNANYNIDIPAPPGAGKMEPNLALVYNNASSNGMIGVGWSLKGFPIIQRTGANIEQDGFKGGIAYNQDDRFAYSGNRLITVAGSVGGDNSIYRTETETWQRFVSFTNVSGGTCGTGPCWWSMTSKKGVSYEFGRTPDSRIAAKGGDGSIRVWALNKIEDLNGNVLTVTYTATPYSGAVDTGQYYPLRIDYTSNTRSNLSAGHQVNFKYEKRPDNIRLFVGGYEVETSARLTQVTTSAGGQAGLQFNLAYELSPSTGRSRVQSITQCSGDGALCFPPSLFSWTDSRLSFSDSGSWLSDDFIVGWNNSDPRMLGDVNGDGLSDIVGFRLDTQVSLGTTQNKFAAAGQWNAGFGSQAGWRDTTSPRMLADVNADGLADVVGFNVGGVEVAVSTGTSFDKSRWSSAAYPYFGFGTGGWNRSRNPRMMADVNGDGRADIVGFNEKTYVGLSEGNKFANPTAWNSSDFAGTHWWQNKNRVRLLGDVNGDGLADIVGFSDGGVIVGVSTGNKGNSFDTTKWAQNAQGYPYYSYAQGWMSGRHPRMLADVNGDGLSDIVGFKDGVQVALSTGRGFLAPQKWNDGFSIESVPLWSSSSTRTLLDVNGDGRADIVGLGTTGARVALSNGSGFVDSWDQNSLNAYRGIAGQLFLISDANGDGLGDVVAMGSKEGQPTQVSVGLSQGPQPDLLNQFTNGLGGTLSITYAPMTSPSVYSHQPPSASLGGGLAQGNAYFMTPVAYSYSDVAANFPIKTVVGGHIYLVNRVVESNNSSMQASSYSYKSLYTYADAKLDVLSQRWLGFARKNRLYENDGRETIEYFYQNYPLDGEVQRREIRCGKSSADLRCSPAALMTVANTEYQAQVTATGTGPMKPQVYDVLKTKQQIDRYTYNIYNYSIANVYQYNAYGDPVVQNYLGYVTKAGGDISAEDNVIVCKDYLNVDPTGAWKLGFLQHIKRTKSTSCANISVFDPAQDLTLSLRTYDQSGNTFNITSDQRWDNQAKKYLTYSYSYDLVGNKVGVIDPQQNTWTTAYDTTFQTFPETESAPPVGDAGLVLKTRMAHDARFGTETAHIGPNGDASITCLDGLGRAIAHQVQRPSGNIATDKNCLTNGLGSQAPVVTVSKTQWLANGKGGLYSETQDLQSWPTGAERDQNWTRSFLDGRGRIYKRVAEANPNTGDVATCVVLDGYNRRPKESLPFFTKTDPDCGPAGDAPHWRTREYDVVSRVVKRTRPTGTDGSQTAVDLTSYADYETAEQNLASNSSNNYRRSFKYKTYLNNRSLWQIVVHSDKDATTTMYRDRLGRITDTVAPATSADPGGIKTSFVLDSLGRKTRIDSPDRGAITFDYEGTENLMARVDAYGPETFSYDAMGRVTRHHLPKDLQLSFGYDSTSVERGLGRRTSSELQEPSKPVVQETYGYDAQANVISVTLKGVEPDPAVLYQTQSVFDPQRNPRQLTLPDGSVIHRQYQYRNLASIGLGNDTLVRYPAYSPQDKPTLIEFGPNAVTDSISYDPSGLMSTQKVTGKAGVYLDRTVAWTEMDEALSITDHAKLNGKDLSQRFGYTSLRLTSAQGIYGDLGYGYDGAGNLTDATDSAGQTSFTYQNFQIRSGQRNGEEVFQAQYDGFGSMTQRMSNSQTWKYDYDAIPRLRSVNLGTSPAAMFHYDADGRRVAKVNPVSGLITTYVGPSYQLVTDNHGATLKTVVLHDDTGTVATVTTGSGAISGPGVPQPGTLFLHKNFLGSTVLTTAPDGAWKGVFAYEPYGKMALAQGADDVRPKFGGKELDSETGLYDFGPRYMDPSIGRFLTADRGPGASSAVQDSLNTYAYVGGRPTSLIDPTGRQVIALIAGIAEGAAAIGEAAAEGAAVASEVGAAVGEGAAAESGASLAEAAATSETTASLATTGETAVEATASTTARTAMVSTDSLANSTLFAGEETAGSSLLETGTLQDSTAFEGESSLQQCPSPCRLSRYYNMFKTRKITLYRAISNVDEIAELENNGILRSPQWRVYGNADIPDNWLGRFYARFLHSLDSSNPLSPYVSTTRSRLIARTFGRNVYQFEVPRDQVYRAWHSPYFWEWEYLGEDGTQVYNATKLD